MPREWLYRQPEWLIAAVFLALMALSLEIGFRLARRAQRRGGDAGATVPTLQGATLGLVGITLAFSFSMASSRYDTRRAMVVREANAIGTAYLRAGLLAGDACTRARGLLRTYVDGRLDFVSAEANPERYRKAAVEAERIHAQIWDLAERAGREDPRPVMASLFVQAVNEVIDVHSLRVHATDDHIPEPVLLMLVIFAIVAAATVGYGAGLGGQRRLLLSVSFCVLVALMLAVVIDADRPGRGLIQVSQKSLIELRDSLHKAGE